jgi:hypothetical protein
MKLDEHHNSCSKAMLNMYSTLFNFTAFGPPLITLNQLATVCVNFCAMQQATSCTIGFTAIFGQIEQVAMSISKIISCCQRCNGGCSELSIEGLFSAQAFMLAPGFFLSLWSELWEGADIKSQSRAVSSSQALLGACWWFRLVLNSICAEAQLCRTLLKLLAYLFVDKRAGRDTNSN